jgi:CTP:molybdopterin cytidylyltransferase MocA
VIAGVVLAAGAGRRFGGLKQLHPIDGVPMLQRVVNTMATADLSELVVVLGARADQIEQGIDLAAARVVRADRWDAGQAASLEAALAALDERTTAALVVLGDGPDLDPAAITRVAEAAATDGERVLAADYGEGRSHPVLLPRTVWARLPRDGETAGRALGFVPVDCRDLRPPGDVDYAS